jgi:TPR repeat protein
MRLVQATKREVDLSERRPVFLMTAEQGEAFARLVNAADRGDGGAACRLGDMYREALGGLRYSPKETHHWYARSAMAGDAHGQNNLGACYEHGLGCRQSYANAVKWYRRAAARRLGTASMNLGYCHLHGHGVPQDDAEALRLFRLAVEQGDEKAAREVERLEGNRDKPKLTVVQGVRFVDRTESEKKLGLAGGDGVAPSKSSEDAGAITARR